MQIVLGCFLILLLLAPLYESFDCWDGFPKSGDDTVLNLIGATAFGGLVLVVAQSLPFLRSALVRAFSAIWGLFQIPSPPRMLGFGSTIGESPPPLHCSQLRI